MLVRLKILFKFFWYWWYILFFNFRYLPFRQAVRLPILLYKPRLVKCKGKITIASDKVWFGMIQLGVCRNRLFPNGGFTWINEGGECVFKGSCVIGNNTGMFIGRRGYVEFGHNFLNTTGLRLVSAKKVIFGENNRIGWDSIVTDTSFHRCKKKNGEWRDGNPDADRDVILGRNNWLGMRCLVLKGSKTPDYAIFGANSTLNKDYSANPSYILMAGNPLKIKSEDIWRDPFDDQIDIDYKSEI